MALVLLTKLVLLLADPMPQFFLGDSEAYLATALHGYVPPDRSFLYGFILRLLLVGPRSFLPLVGLQATMSAGVALMALYVLRAKLFVPGPLALVTVLLLSLDPLTLVYERHVLPGTWATFVFGLYVLVGLAVIDRPSASRTVGFQLLSTLLIAFRMSYLPVTQAATLVLPVLVWWKDLSGRGPTRWRRAALSGGRVLAVGLASFALFHTAYRHLNGALRESEPAYLHHDGFFMLGLVSPILEPEDAVSQNLAALIGASRESLTYKARNYQIFGESGLAMSLRRLVPDEKLANLLAKETARRAMRRDPLGLLGLELRTYTTFFRADLGELLANGENLQVLRPFPDRFRERLRRNLDFHAEADWFSRATLTRGYLLHAPWSLYPILLTPLVALPVLWARRADESKHTVVWLCFLLAAALGSHLIGPPTARYLLGVGFLGSILLGEAAAQLLRRAGNSAATDPDRQGGLLLSRRASVDAAAPARDRGET